MNRVKGISAGFLTNHFHHAYDSRMRLQHLIGYWSESRTTRLNFGYETIYRDFSPIYIN